MPPATGGVHIFAHSGNHPSAEAAKRFPGQLHAQNSGRPGVRDGKQDGVPAVATGKVMANCHVHCTCCPYDKEITKLLNPRRRVILAKPTDSHQVINFPVLFGNQRFVTVFTTACHLISGFHLTLLQSITFIVPLMHLIIQNLEVKIYVV
jgi:hypothetical protein